MTYSLEELLPFALTGLEKRKEEIDLKIAEIRQLLGHTAGRPSAAPEPVALTPTGRRPFTAAARERMAKAQRERWAAKRAAESKTPARTKAAAKSAVKKSAVKKSGVKKRTMSAEARERIAEAQRKRWAASRKAS